MISYFEFNGKKSSDFGIRIYNDLEFQPAQRRFEEIEVLGRDGVLLIDNKSYKNVDKTINFDIQIKENPINGGDGSLIFNKVLEISKWLTVDEFKEFKYSMYPDFIFKAIVIDDYNIKDTIRNFGRGSIKFKFEPFMYYKDGLNEIKVTSGMNLKNIGLEATPLIRIIPKDKRIDISNNGKRWLSLENLQMQTTIDSELMQAYNIVGNANKNIVANRPIYPVLQKGDNVITFDSTKADVYIIPRYKEAII